MALVDRRLFGLLGFVAVGVVASSLPACSRDDKSGLMLAISTDMRAPKDVNAVGITVSNNGTVKFSILGRVTPEGEVLLPATLAIAEPDDPNATVGIRVIAFQERKARVMRDVRTSIPKGGRIALLRIPLNFANDGGVSGELPDGVLPTAAATKSFGGGTLFPRDIISTPGYDSTPFVPNCADPTQTWIAGECADAFVPWKSLPTFTPGDVGRADDSATCFDVDDCYRGSTDIPESGDTGVTLDRASCSLLLHGADPAQVNVALVTAATGECIKPGSCYIPLDHGAAGWTESDGRVQLPGYVCKLTPKDASLVLAPTTSKVCGAKTESRAFCSSTSDAGTSVGAVRTLVSGEDFATSIVVDSSSKTLYSAGSTRIARIDLTTGKPTSIAAVTEKKPWKFGSLTAPGAMLTDGTGFGQVFDATGGTQNVQLPGGGSDATEVDVGWLWTTGPLAFTARGTVATPVMPVTRVNDTSAITHVRGRFVVGDVHGTATSCTVDFQGTISCYPTVTVAGKPIRGLAEDLTSGGLGIWVLAEDGVFYLTTDATAGTLTKQSVFGGTFPGVTDGALTLQRAIVGAGRCAIFSDLLGLEWIIPDGKGGGNGGVIVSHTPNTPEILGVTVDATSVYYTVYAAASAGGGVYRADLPAECLTH